MVPMPFGGLIADANGDLFGTTDGGGANGDGTVFEIAKTATGYASTPTTLVSFNGTNGQRPVGQPDRRRQRRPVRHDNSGRRERRRHGVRDRQDRHGYASTPTTLVSFNGTNGGGPYGSLIADANGDLFGTTDRRRCERHGTVFEIAKTAPATPAPPSPWSASTAPTVPIRPT